MAITGKEKQVFDILGVALRINAFLEDESKSGTEEFQIWHSLRRSVKVVKGGETGHDMLIRLDGRKETDSVDLDEYIGIWGMTGCIYSIFKDCYIQGEDYGWEDRRRFNKIVEENHIEKWSREDPDFWTPEEY